MLSQLRCHRTAPLYAGRPPSSQHPALFPNFTSARPVSLAPGRKDGAWLIIPALGTNTFYPGEMAHTWSRLHEHVGCPPGPLSFELVRRCADDGLAEADDLDWKECLPNGRDPQAQAEFAKDVAAMANTRGGLIIFGVADQPVKFTGITAGDANADQYGKWVRNLVQPYLSGLDQYILSSKDGRETAFVVDVPASELAPHSVAFDHTKDQAKSQYATVTPYRSGPHTEWMAEHQIARAYTERLTHTADWQASFGELRDWTVDSLEGRGGEGTAWLILIGRPTRPVPRSAPRLDGETARSIVAGAWGHPVADFQQRAQVLDLLAAGQGHLTVGLNAWVITNRVGAEGLKPREVRVELHHDGSFVFVANLSQHTLIDKGNDRPEVAVVNADVIEQACVDLEALLLQLLRTERIDSPMRVQISVSSEGNLPLKCAVHSYEHYYLPAGAAALPRLRPVTVDVEAGATGAHTQPAAAELAAGILNQFGQGCQLQRYIR